jgi:hypothetical protein
MESIAHLLNAKTWQFLPIVMLKGAIKATSPSSFVSASPEGIEDEAEGPEDFPTLPADNWTAFSPTGCSASKHFFKTTLSPDKCWTWYAIITVATFHWSPVKGVMTEPTGSFPARVEE